MSNYTKGEWKTDQRGNTGIGIYSILPDGEESEEIALVDDISDDLFPNDDQTEVNAHLIAAAPDMYEALKSVVEYENELSYANPSALSLVLKRAKEALGKIEGNK